MALRSFDLRGLQFEIQMRLHRRPFGGGDAVDAGVAQRAVGGTLMITQNAVELGAEALDGAAALMVEEMSAEFYRKHSDGLESVGEEQKLCVRVEGRALDACGVPGGTDFNAAVDLVDVHVGGHAGDAAGGVEDREGGHGAGVL